MPASQDSAHLTTHVVFADLAESMVHLASDEAKAIERLDSLFDRLISQNVNPPLVKLTERAGDALIFEVTTAAQAMALALRIHAAAKDADTAQAQWQFRIGIFKGDVVVVKGRGQGLGISMAARIAQRAQPRETWLCAQTAADLVDGIDCHLRDRGDCFVRHVEEPIRLYSAQSQQSFEGLREQAFVPKLDTSKSAVLIALPFESVDTSQQIKTGIAYGVIATDQLISNLSKSPFLKLISRLSSQAIQNSEQSKVEASKKIGATHLVFGTYTLIHNRVLISCQLMDVVSQTVLFADQFEGKPTDLLKLKSDLNIKMAQAISQTLYAQMTSKAGDAPLPNLDSFSLLLSGINCLYRQSAHEYPNAKLAFEELKGRAPNNPIPYAWLARWHLFNNTQGWSSDPKQEGLRALDFAKRAIDLDPSVSFVHTVMGQALTNVKKDLESAKQCLQHAIELNGSDPLAWLQLGNVMSFSGAGQEALEATSRAILLSPLDPFKYFYLNIHAGAALAAGNYQLAEKVARDAVRLNSTHVSTLRCLAIALSMQDKVQEARPLVQRILQLQPNLTAARYVAQSPGSHVGLAKVFSQALVAAGLPR